MFIALGVVVPAGVKAQNSVRLKATVSETVTLSVAPNAIDDGLEERDKRAVRVRGPFVNSLRESERVDEQPVVLREFDVYEVEFGLLLVQGERLRHLWHASSWVRTQSS